ncbi:MAG: YceI family protein [Bacteroidia bacterium]|nr:YceI family protein [Bacteroidia bacterium]
MKNLLFTLVIIALSNSVGAQIYLAKSCEITFFSAAPIENIEAINKSTKPIINTTTGDVQMKIVISGFMFEKPLMQEHFNENYMESEKFPNAIYKGKINEKIDWTKDGDHKVTITGTFDIHGVKKDRTIDGIIKIKGQEVNISSNFKIHIADYNIKVPSLYIKNIAEDVDVKLNATLEPLKKN